MRVPKPEIAKFIDEQVKVGRFSSADDAVESAVEKMMLESECELDQATIDAINRAEAQLDRGQEIEFAKFSYEMRKKFAVMTYF